MTLKMIKTKLKELMVKPVILTVRQVFTIYNHAISGEIQNIFLIIRNFVTHLAQCLEND